MIKNIFKKFFILFLLTSILFASFANKSFAIVDKAQEANYKVIGSGGNQTFSASMPSLKPWPYFNIQDDKDGDLSIELGNPFCLSYIGAYFAAMYAGNTTAKLSATAALVAGSLAIYGVSAIKYRDFEICGANWLVWGSNNLNATNDIIRYYPELGAFNGSRKRVVLDCLRNGECGSLSLKNKDFTMNDRVFRENYYDGEEVVNNNCKDPREERKNYDIGGNGQTYYMRGYAQGNYACERFLVPDDESKINEFKEAYDCCVKATQSVCITNKHKITFDVDEEGVAIVPATENFFCDKDKQYCKHGAFIFEIFKSQEGEKGVYCARTWSLCPYNFNIEKGSEKKLFFEKDEHKDSNGDVVIDDPCFDSVENRTLSCAGKIKNFYQYKRHCTIVEPWYAISNYENNSYAPFVDKSCINFVGSSHNTLGYKSYNGYETMFKTYQTFTAPAVECITETLKNFLFNRAGHTKCLNTGGFPDVFGNCPYGYEYKEGDDLFEVKGNLDPVSRLLKYIDVLLKLTLTIMVVLYGYGILTNTVKLERKEILMKLLVLTLVLGFASSKWWREQLFHFIYGTSSYLSELTSRTFVDDTKDLEYNLIKYDGCYFGNINKAFGRDILQSEINIEENNYYNYPVNRRYISIFDTLDCKIHKYLGVSAGKNLPNALAVVALSIIWPFNIGIFLAVASIMMFLFVITFAIKAAYIFIAASISIALLLYVSPIIIPCVLFKSQKKIFDTWLNNLIGYTLQPIFLLAFVAISLNIMDRYMIGEGIYKGAGPQRELVCGYSCKNIADGTITSYSDKSPSNADCDENEDIINLKAKSPICFLEKATATPFTVLNSLGIFISVIKDVQLTDLIMFLRIAFLFFILNHILGTIPDIANNLAGTSVKLPGADKEVDPFTLARKAKGFGAMSARAIKYSGISIGKPIGHSVMKLKNKIFGKNKESSDDDKESSNDDKND